MKTTRELPYHENVIMDSPTLPFRISYMESDSTYKGCEYHWHEELEFYYVRRGAVLLFAGGQRQWIRAGEIGYINWCEPHRGMAFLDGTRHYILQIHPDFFDKEFLTMPCSDKQVNFLSLLLASSFRFPTVLGEDRDMCWYFDHLICAAHKKTAGWEFMIKSCFYGVFSTLLKYLPNSEFHSVTSREFRAVQRIRDILVYLSCNYMIPENVALPVLGAHFGLSVNYLCRLFNKYTGTTLTSYIKELRISRATILIQSGVSLEETAFATGFQDYNYFSRVFKQVYGIPPSELKDKTLVKPVSKS